MVSCRKKKVSDMRSQIRFARPSLWTMVGWRWGAVSIACDVVDVRGGSTTYGYHAQHDCAEAEDDGVDGDHVEDVATGFEFLENEVESRVEDYGLRYDVCAP